MNDDKGFIRHMAERHRHMHEEMLGVHNKAMPIALATREPALHEPINPDDQIQRYIGVRTVLTNRYPARGKPAFIVEYTQIAPFSQENQGSDSTDMEKHPDDADLVKPEDKTHKISLRFVMKTGEPVRIRTSYEDRFDSLVDWQVQIQPFDEEQYRLVTDEEFDACVMRAHELLDQYPLDRPSNP